MTLLLYPSFQSFTDPDNRTTETKKDGVLVVDGQPPTTANGTPNESAAGTPYMNGSSALPASSQFPKIEGTMDVDTPPPPASTQAPPAADGTATDSEKPADGTNPPPTKRYRLNSRMRDIIWELVALSNEAVRIENEKK